MVFEKDFQNITKKIDEISKEYRSIYEKNIKLYRENEQLKIDAVSPAIQNLKEEIKEISAASMIQVWNKDNQKTIRDFVNKHKVSCGFGHSFVIGGDGLVTYVTVTCPKCNEEITVYE